MPTYTVAGYDVANVVIHSGQDPFEDDDSGRSGAVGTIFSVSAEPDVFNITDNAAERMGDRIQRLVYFDAQVVFPGETPASNSAPEDVAIRRQMAHDSSGGLSLPPPPAEAMGISDPADASWLEAMMTPHPWRTFETPLEIEQKPGAGKPALYIACTEPVYKPLAWARARAAEIGWDMAEIAAGHDAMISAPEALADLLEGA